MLSGRILDDQLDSTRELENQDEKHNHRDFALWKNAAPEHIMRWKSPWGEGFPGWHIECSVMAEEHLGDTIDIHAGGADLKFPHHENEIAQSVCAHGGAEFARHWLHNGFVTIEGRKMSKSLKNFIPVREFLRAQEARLSQLPALSGLLRRMSMKTTARNQFAGTVSHVDIGPVSAQVTIALKSGDEITATLTSAIAGWRGLRRTFRSSGITRLGTERPRLDVDRSQASPMACDTATSCRDGKPRSAIAPSSTSSATAT